MLDKIEKGIHNTTVFLEKVNHMLNYVLIAVWLITVIVFVIKMVSRLWN